MRLSVKPIDYTVYWWPWLCCFVLAAALCSTVVEGAPDDPSRGSSKSPQHTEVEVVDVLEEFFHATSGSQWRSNRGWLQNNFPCGIQASDESQGGGTNRELLPWKGVRCDGGGNVVALTLPMNDLQGTLPASLSQLSHLRTLDVALNALSSTIPTSLFSQCSSVRCSSGAQAASGTPPVTGIDVSYNRLEISLEAIRSERLRSLDASWNARMSGRLSDIALNVPNLEELHLDFMDLSGSSLQSLGRLSRLRAVSLSGSAIGTPLQSLNSRLPHLRELDLSHNALSGSLPSNWTCNFPNLEVLHLNGNHLEGAAPHFFEPCCYAKRASPCVEAEEKEEEEEEEDAGEWGQQNLARLPRIIDLDISDNAFSSFQSGDFKVECAIDQQPTALNAEIGAEGADTSPGPAPVLRSLKLSGNEFADRINVAALLSKFGRTLQTFECASCALSGQLPLVAQEESQIATTTLPGEYCPHCGTRTTTVLETLRLENNKLIGRLDPDVLCSSFSQLRTIGLHGNFFSGPFPSCLLHLPAVESIDLSSNRLTSLEVFDSQCVVSARQEGSVFSTGNNSGSGAAWRCLGAGGVHVSESLRELRLHDNHLQGTIPLGGFRTVSYLDFADNNFSACDDYGSAVEPGCSSTRSCFSQTLGQGFGTTVNLCGNFKSPLSRRDAAQCGADSTCEQPSPGSASWLTAAYPHFPTDISRRNFLICGTRNVFFAEQLVAHGWREVTDAGAAVHASSNDAWTTAYGACYGDVDNPLQRLGSRQLVSRFDDLSPIADKGKLSTNIATFAAAVEKLQDELLATQRSDSGGNAKPQLRLNTHHDTTSMLGFYPKSYVLPRDMGSWVRDMNTSRSNNATLLWLLKPRAQCCGRGIRLVTEPPAEVLTPRTEVHSQWYAQQFVHPPKLVGPGGQKFVFRVFVLVTSLSPLRVYVYNNGLVFYSRPEAPYGVPVAENVGNDTSSNTDNAPSFSHSNETMDKRRYITDYFFTEMQLRHAMTTRTLLQHLFPGTSRSSPDNDRSQISARIEQLWSRVRHLTTLSLLAAQDDLAAVQRRHPHGGTRAGAFEVLGLDIAFDDRMQPYLCEINSAPNMGLEVNRVDAARDWEGYLRLRRWDTLYKQRLLAAALDLAGVQPAWMEPLNSTRAAFESPRTPEALGTNAFEAPSPFMPWALPHARVNASFIIATFGLSCGDFALAANPQLCLDQSDMHYVQQVHTELLRLHWFSFRPSSRPRTSGGDEIPVDEGVPLDTNSDVDVGLDRFEPVFPCVACLDHGLLSGTRGDDEWDESSPRTTLLSLRLRNRRHTMLGNWWHEVFAAILDLDNHKNCSATGELNNDNATISEQTLPQCSSLPKPLRWHIWMSMRHVSPSVRQVLLNSGQHEVTVGNKPSDNHDDHCHVQQCHVDLGRLAPEGAPSQIQIVDRYCKFERSHAERVECLTRRRGGVEYANASNFSVRPGAPAPWRLQPQPWTDLQRGLLFVKNMKTGGSTLRTVLEKWVASRTKGARAASSHQRPGPGRSECREGQFCLVAEEQPLSRLAIRGGRGAATMHERETASAVGPGYFWVTTVRHPVARTKSYFEHSRRHALRCLARRDVSLPPQTGNSTKCGASHLLHGFKHFWTASTAPSAPPAFAAAALRDRQWSWMENGLSTVGTGDAATKRLRVDVVDPMHLASAARQAVDQFDMVFVCCEGSTFDDSLLVLHLQLGIRVADMLYTTSKRFPNCAASAANLSGSTRETYLALCEQAAATDTLEDSGLQQDIEKANPHDLEIYHYALGRLNATVQALEPHFSRARERFRRIRLRSRSACRDYLPEVEDGLGDEGGPDLGQRQTCFESFCASDSECTAGLFV